MYQYIKLKLCFQYAINAFHWIWSMWSRALLFYVLLQRTELGSNKAIGFSSLFEKCFVKVKFAAKGWAASRKYLSRGQIITEISSSNIWHLPKLVSIMSYIPFPTTVCTPYPISTTPILARTHNDFLLPNTANKCNKVNKTYSVGIQEFCFQHWLIIWFYKVNRY